MTADKNMNILAVDDSDVMIKQLVIMLKKLEFKNVDTATNGPDAMSLIYAKRYELIISDWNMEPISGLELLKDIRFRGHRMPFIMITTQCTVERKVEAFEFGATDFLIKPFTVDTLSTSIFWALSKTARPAEKKV